MFKNVVKATLVAGLICANVAHCKTTDRSLVVVDMLNDFLGNGSCGVRDGQKVTNHCAQLLDVAHKRYNIVYVLMDNHTPKTNTFDEEHCKMYSDHALDGTDGAKLAPSIAARLESLARNGMQITYLKKREASAFDENYNKDGVSLETEGRTEDGKKFAELIKGSNKVDYIGVCTNICVKGCAMGNKKNNPKARIGVIEECVDDLAALPEGHEQGLKEMRDAGIKIKSLEKILAKHGG